MKHRIAERYFALVLMVVIFLASLQASSQTRVAALSEKKSPSKLASLNLKLSPRDEEEWIEVAEPSRALASATAKPDSSHEVKRRGKILPMHVLISDEPELLPRLAPPSIQEGRDLSPSFKSNPYYIPASAQLFRF